jgi:hypothetical protein
MYLVTYDLRYHRTPRKNKTFRMTIRVMYPDDEESPSFSGLPA